MAPSNEGHQAKKPPTKLQKLPKNARVEKRPLLRPPIPARNAGRDSQKVVYISQRTPFVAAVKRVRKLLALADKRAVQSKSAHISKDDPKRIDKMARVVVERGRGQGQGGEGEEEEEEEEVWVKATGRSVQKALQLAVYFQEQQDLDVRVRTGSVWAIDDIVLDGEDGEHGEGGAEEGEEQGVPETRMRQTSLLEVAVSLR